MIPKDFFCEYATGPGRQCPVCDCFVETHPDSPFDLHPEDFMVNGVQGRPVRPRHLLPHATFGDDPSGWCGCAGCDPRDDCGCRSCRHPSLR